MIPLVPACEKGYAARLSSQDFTRLSHFIHTRYGIKMPPLKKTMLESRLQKRIAAHGFATCKAYCDYLFSQEGMAGELVHMIDVVTTNKTDFFREPAHFDFLTNRILPQYKNRGNPFMKIWSAGCSSGEEVYTIAMVIEEYLHQTSLRLQYALLGTDISTQILEKAQAAVYSEDRIVGIPLALKKKYFLRSKDPLVRKARVVPELRKKVSYQRLNFMNSQYDVPGSFDVIFCRNVLIYFDKAVQEKVINRLCSRLKEGGYFFLGHSESISTIQVPLRQIQPTVFVRM
jgi:chemotaxis protein methyltransferase CheR